MNHTRPLIFIRQLFGAYRKCRRGLAAVEFALIAPVMLVLFFGVVEGSAALSANRKVILSANTLSDLVAQETSLTRQQLDDLFVGMEDIIDNRDINAEFKVYSLFYDSNSDDVKVDWSYDSKKGEPYAPGSVYEGPLDVTVLDDASSIIVGETIYKYSSPVTQHIIGPMTLEKLSSHWPRRSNRVQLCTSAGVCSTTSGAGYGGRSGGGSRDD